MSDLLDRIRSGVAVDRAQGRDEQHPKLRCFTCERPLVAVRSEGIVVAWRCPCGHGEWVPDDEGTCPACGGELNDWGDCKDCGEAYKLPSRPATGYLSLSYQGPNSITRRGNRPSGRKRGKRVGRKGVPLRPQWWK